MSAKFAISAAVKELRFHMCQGSAASAPLRSFLTKNYPVIKSSTNHKIPVLIRESFGVSP
ncbi:hypothetical protein OXX69_013830, partial [Metschnikowia pulcherrima]